MQRLYEQLNKLTNRYAFAWLLVGIVVCNLGFAWRSAKFGSEKKLLDARFWYSQTEAQEFLNDLEPGGRNLYAATELTLDILYPLVYTATLGVLMLWLYPENVAKKLLVLPMMGGGFDLPENIQLAFLALTFDGSESVVAVTAALCTATKFVFLAASVAVVVVGVAGRFWPWRIKAPE
jgi:hypothetical protein